MPTVVKIATPEHSANATFKTFSTWFRARYFSAMRRLAITKPINAALTTTANFANEPMFSIFFNCSAAASS